MENLFNRAIGEDVGGGWLAEFTPRADLAETDKNYEVTAELPGLKPEEITVELRGDTLTIAGERREEKEKKEKTYHYVERKYGKFHRTMTLPEAGDPGKVTAEFKNGVLTVLVPKNDGARATKVKVTG
jgi:HSP20 family protein